MVSPILFAGGEDLNYQTIGCGVIQSSVPGTANFGVDATATHFRSGYARFGIGASFATAQQIYLRSNIAFSSSNFWTTGRLWNNNTASGNNPGNPIMRWCDSSGVVRLRLRQPNSTSYPGLVTIDTVNAAGTAVTLATSVITMGSQAPSVADKIDVYINYAVAGTFTVYFNGTQIVTYSGDITTNGQTSLSYVDLGWPGGPNVGGTVNIIAWSECIVSTRDTRNMSLLTQAPTANGTTHNWDQGTAANAAANIFATSDAAPQYASSAGLIQEYQVTPAPPTGNFGIISVVQMARATVGSSGPTKFEFVTRTGGADFVSTPDVSPGAAWATYVYLWDTNPNTSAPWLTSELPASSTSFNMGLKSIT